MPLTSTKPAYAFIQGGGEMGALTRAFNWSETSLGMPDEWPQSLRTTLGILLHTAFPMFLFWGDDLLCFYNDAYRPSLGTNGKHPAILGKPGKEAWPEIWDFIGPLIQQVMATGEPVWFEDQLVPIYRNGQLEDVYWTFSYSPAYSDNGQINGILVTCTETTEKVANIKRIKASEAELSFAINAAELAIWDLDPATNIFNADTRLKDWFGLASHEEIDLPQAVQVIAENDRQRVMEAIGQAMQYESGGRYDIQYTIIHPVTGHERVVRAKGKVQFGSDQVAQQFNGIIQDITEQQQAEQIRRESEERFRTMAEGTDILIATGDESSKAIYFNKAWVDLTGRPMQELLDFGWVDLVHPGDRERYVNIYLSAFEKRESFTGEFRVLNKSGEYRWLLAKGTARLRPDGSFAGYISSCVDITERKQAEEALRSSEQRFQAAIAAVQGILWTNNAKGEMEGEQPGWAALTGQTYEEYQGYGWASAVHPDDAQPTVDAWEKAIKKRGTFVFEHRVRVKSGDWESFSIRAIPLINPDGSIREWVGVHTNITKERQAQAALRASEAKFRSLIEEAPVATCVFVGRDMRIEIANDTMIGYWGKGNSVMNKPLAEVLPELAGQPFLQQLDEVFTTGQTYEAKAARADLVVDDVPQVNYFDYTYKPLRNARGEVYAIMDMAVNVTEEVTTRRKIEEAESALRGAIELAELGTWQIDLVTGILDYSERLRGWFGIDTTEIITSERAYRPVLPADRPRVRAAIAHAITPGTDGIYDIEYAIDPAEAGQERILHIQGKAFLNEKGEPYKLSGTAQDVTKERRLQQELERQVQERTRQLQASVLDLERSNQNLQQFAYIASHDLQEPLRKIQSFGDILSTQYADSLGEGLDLLQRMQMAASRMSILIKDLLAFSRISTRQESAAIVSLTQVVNSVLTDLDLIVQETDAVIDIGPLPTVQGDASQLGQLFQNLLTNALKFRRTDSAGKLIRPVIRIQAQEVHAGNLPTSVRPTREVSIYHRIDVSDNGIGFEQKYVDRIFQVFQRLHGRRDFVGTGIGLAICEKVVANHGGAIMATSQPGQGATFSVYLPTTIK